MAIKVVKQDRSDKSGRGTDVRKTILKGVIVNETWSEELPEVVQSSHKRQSLEDEHLCDQPETSKY